ncbi:hypothetical protein NOC27_303 [Nitrosococcus oceani AFC27]|nr:hypothetical protein NOC27_303 [Nitrosococcus oceani AFC27]
MDRYDYRHEDRYDQRRRAGQQTQDQGQTTEEFDEARQQGEQKAGLHSQVTSEILAGGGQAMAPKPAE